MATADSCLMRFVCLLSRIPSMRLFYAWRREMRCMMLCYRPLIPLILIGCWVFMTQSAILQMSLCCAWRQIDNYLFTVPMTSGRALVTSFKMCQKMRCTSVSWSAHPLLSHWFFTNGTMYILDSHRHVAHGAAIIVPGCCLSAVQLANHLICYLSASEVYELDLSDCHLAMLELN